MVDLEGASAPPLIAQYQQQKARRRQEAQQAGQVPGGQIDPLLQVQFKMLRTLRRMHRGNGQDNDLSDDGDGESYMRRSKAGGINELHRLRVSLRSNRSKPS